MGLEPRCWNLLWWEYLQESPLCNKNSPRDGVHTVMKACQALEGEKPEPAKAHGLRMTDKLWPSPSVPLGFKWLLFCLFLPDGPRPPPLSCQYWDFFRSFLTWEADQLCDSLAAHSLLQSHIPGLLLAAIYFSSTDGFIKAILLICNKKKKSKW